MPRNFTEELIGSARAGDMEALGSLLEQHRERFRIIARQKLGSVLKQRIDPSDVIQQTFLEAKRDFHCFKGEAPEQFVAWLNKILENNLGNTIQFHLLARKRSVLRERSGRDREQSPEFDPLPLKQLSPSQLAVQRELREHVKRTVDQLPVIEGEAIRLRYLQDHSLDEIAEQLQRSKQAVAGLLKRGLRRLRDKMPQQQDSDS